MTTKDALVDTGANGYIFVSTAFARKMVKHLHVEQDDRFTPRPIGGFDGKVSQKIDVAVKANIKIQGRTFIDEWMIVLDMTHDIILGLTWLREYDIIPDPPNRRLLFPETILPDPPWRTHSPADLSPKMRSDEYDKDVVRREALMEEEDRKRRIAIEVRRRVQELEDDERRPRRDKPTPPPPRQDNPTFTDCSPKQILQRGAHPGNELDQVRRAVKKMDRAIHAPAEHPDTKHAERKARERRRAVATIMDKIDARFASIESINLLKSKDRCETSWTTLHEIDRMIQDKQEMLPDQMPDDDETLRRKAFESVPHVYHEYLDVFSKAESDRLAPHREGVDHRIELKEGKSEDDLGFSPLYKMSLEELEACRDYITDNLRKGFIVPSSTPWSSPVLMAAKNDGGLRFCVDFRKVNALTKGNQYPLPLIEETLSRIAKAKILTKIDIRQAFHKIRMHPDSEDLTTFRTRYGSYKYKVMPFGLSGGPATFQRFVNSHLIGYLDEFCHAYIDDILIFSNSIEEHEAHVKKVLSKLREIGLQADLKKCEFHVPRTKYLGFIVGVDGIAVDPDKVTTVENWETPKTLKGVQAFLGFCNFYRKFVKDYSRIAKPLTALTKKDAPFHWSPNCEDAFHRMKKTLLMAPILAHFDHARQTKVETDASDGVVAGVLSQLHDDEEWHPVAFFSETMQGAEHNYSIHDKELLAVVRALQCWRAELVGLQTPAFTVITDHQALEYFGTKRLLNFRQAGWAEFLAQYKFVITYRPGVQNAAADALSRKSEDVKTQKERKEVERTLRIFRPLTTEDDPEYSRDVNAVNTINEITGPATVMVLDEDVPPPTGSGTDLTDAILTANRESADLEVWREKARQDLEGFSMLDEKLLLHKGRMVVPDENHLRAKIIQEAHSRIITAHPGRTKTRKIVSSRYWWPRMTADVDRFVANCLCRASKDPRDKTPGLLHPLPIPLRSWRSLAMDFNKLPPDRSGANNALVIIDRLSKQSCTIPCKDTATAKTAARLFYEGPYRWVGLPEEIVSDRGPQFISAFTDELSKTLGISWRLASAGHSQTAGQVEIMNEYINQRLRPFVSHQQDNWAAGLPALDAVQGSLPHESLGGLSPHEVTAGYPMPMPFDWQSRTNLKDADNPLTTKERLTREEAQKAARTIQTYVEVARKVIAKAQERQARQANKHRREPDFGVGDRVFIIKKVWSTDRPSTKLDYPLTRSHYKIEAMEGHSFRLEVPDQWKGTTVFPADRLRKYPNNPLPGQEAENPSPDLLDGEEEWELERVLTARLYYHKLQYQVEWKGWDPDPTWYPASDFKNAARKLEEFHARNPEHPGPPKRLGQWKEAAENDEFAGPHKDDDLPAKEGTQLRRSARRTSN